MEFYTIQFILKEFEEYVDKENKEYEKVRRDSEKKSNQASFKPPSNFYGDYKTPKFEMPKFNMPKP